MASGRKAARTGLMLALAALLAFAGWPAGNVFGQANGQTKPELGTIAVQAADARKADYLRLTFEPGHWQAGTIVSQRPLAVVALRRADDETRAYELQVWRGTGARVGDDLLTYWDVIEVDAAGRPTAAFLDFERAIRGYFAAPSQAQFRTVADADAYPWADVPTDAEAAAAGRAPIAADAYFDLYGVSPRAAGGQKAVDVDPQRAPAPQAGAGGLASTAGLKVPADIRTHWAKDAIMQLIALAAMKGYGDGTIKPNGTLTRAEYAAMLARALKLPAAKGADAGFADLKGHWAAPEVAALAEAGAATGGEGGGRYRPNEAITRVETIRLLGAFLPATAEPAAPAYGIPNAPFTDLANVADDDVRRIGDAYIAGIVGGDPSGRLRPNDTLTRAEAAKIIVKLLLARKGGDGR